MNRQPIKRGVVIQRSSKISMALRKNFINSILEDGLSIKKAAAKFKLNYSTAKVIFQRYKADKAAKERLLRGESSSQSDLKENQEEKARRIQELQKYRCSYKEINSGDSASGSQSTSSSKQQKIVIISTVAWDFMRDGLPSFN